MKCHVSLFQPMALKIYIRNYSPSSFCTFLQNFNLILKEKFMTIFPKSPVWNIIQESAKKSTSSDHISANIARKALKFGPKVQCNFFSNGFFFRFWNIAKKKSYSENSMMTYLEQWNPRIQSSDTKCNETSSQRDRKERSTPQNSTSSRGQPPLHYTNEQFLNDTNEKSSFLYIGV